MPIAVSCSCGKSFQAPDTLAGRRVKCPACGQPVQVAASDTAVGSNRPAAKQRAAASDPHGMAELFDEVDLKHSSTGRRCPECRKDLQPDDILCVNCGYNTETGKKLQTQAVKGKGEKLIHGVRLSDKRPVARPSSAATQTMKQLLMLAILIAVAIAVGIWSLGQR